LLIYTVVPMFDEHLVYVASKRFPDDTALVAVFKTEDAANAYADAMNQLSASR
jgi:hypothetical protein